jgi:NADH-quinone oxidoreductase subunit C
VTALRPASVADVLTTGLGVEVTVGVDGTGTPVADVPVSHWLDAAQLLRDALELDFLDWLSAVDQPDGDPAGIDVVLHVADARAATRRVLLRTRVAETDLRLASLSSLWPGVAWHERETFEMFGVGFDGYADDSGLPLRPLLLPDGFEGTPLRKSFVLAARASKAWPGAKEPGESDATASSSGPSSPGRRKTLPPGVPDPATWGPRDAQDEASTP